MAGIGAILALLTLSAYHNLQLDRLPKVQSSEFRVPSS